MITDAFLTADRTLTDPNLDCDPYPGNVAEKMITDIFLAAGRTFMLRGADPTTGADVAMRLSQAAHCPSPYV